MTSSPTFSGLAPDTRKLRGAGDFAHFDLRDALALGRRIGRQTANGVRTEDIAGALVDGIHAFDHAGRPACALVRTFVSCTIDSLPPDLRASLRTGDGAAPLAGSRCLRLVATRGIDPAWNEVEHSKAHRAVLFEANATPMVTELIRQLRPGDPVGTPVADFFVADAVSSGAISDKPFLLGNDVRSVVGFATRPWAGEHVVTVAFVRAAIDRSIARALAIVGPYVKLAWLETQEGVAALGEALPRARVEARDELVAALEAEVQQAVVDSRRRLDDARSGFARSLEEAKRGHDAQQSELKRTQRAMLNVVDDLREARQALEVKVEERTRELAAANRLLALRNRELEEFAYIASHDLQEPLRTIAGYLQMIERRYGAKLGPEGDEFIGFAIDGAQRMQALIQSLLEYTRLSRADRVLEPLALDEALDLALRNLALRVEESGATIERKPLPRVRADRNQMVQLFQNLLSNALKFAGGRPPKIRVSGTVADAVVAIRVRDEGIGFDPKFAERIFKVFRRLRRDTEGTGIGLAICKKIVERHGGRIEVDSAPSQGSTFTIHLPQEKGANP